jgi:hypothetical protein
MATHTLHADHRFELVTGTPFNIICIECKRRGVSDGSKGPVSQWWADLNGEAFTAYYCDDCKGGHDGHA